MATTAGGVVTLRELNRTLLARQLLLRRHELSVEEAVERLSGLQAQWPPSPYVALWSRLEGFEREQLVEALAAGRVVKATLMRRTLHLVSARDYQDMIAVLRPFWVEHAATRSAANPGSLDVAELARRAAEYARTPRFRTELNQALGVAPPPDGELTWTVWSAVQATACLVHAPESAYWRTSGTPALVALPQTPSPDPTDAAVRVVRRYLGAFGPASRADLASWSGLPASRLADALAALADGLRALRDERGRTLLDLHEEPIDPAETPAPVRFLAKWDSALLAYEPRFRDRILPERFRRNVIVKNGDVAPTFLVDGFVAGVWRVERRRGAATLVLEPLERLGRAAKKELAQEGERLARFVEPEAISVATSFAG